MSITLLTSVPGGGKTSYSVWYEIKKAHEAGRVVYTCGIPQLKIPTIELSYDQVREWYLRDDSGDLPVLENIERGALIVIDEVQKLWPATGSKITQDIKDLSEHRHFGLSFFLMTQSPNLIHRNVLALVDRHLHIRPNWSGRKIYEWPEFCRNPSASSNKSVAVVSSYTLPDKAFSLYHSASVHIKPKKKIPLPFFGFLAVLLAIPFLIYASYDRIASKGNNVEAFESVETFDNVEVDEVVMLDSPPVEDVVLSPVLPTLLSGRYDWQNVAGCMRSEEIGCVCYGESAERLVIPLEACQIAVRHGWTRRSVRVSAPVQVSASN